MDYASPGTPKARSVSLSLVALQQALVGFICSLILDGGGLMRCFLVAAAAYWVGYVVLRLRFRTGQFIPLAHLARRIVAGMS
jgi:hypothetical protein